MNVVPFKVLTFMFLPYLKILLDTLSALSPHSGMRAFQVDILVREVERNPGARVKGYES
jgi:hypothetical protein